MQNNLKATKPRMLFTTPIIHYPIFNGPTLRIQNSIKALSQVSDLYVYSRISIDEIGGIQALEFYKQYCKKIFFSPYSRLFLTNILNITTEKIFKKKYFAPHSESLEIYQDILKRAEEIKADIIWLGFGNISYPLLTYLKEKTKIPIVVDTDSVWSEFIGRGAKYAKSDLKRKAILSRAKLKLSEERLGTSLSDVTTAVSEFDAGHYRKFVDTDTKIKLFPNTIGLNDYATTRMRLKLKRPAIMLSGTFWAESPMLDAANWFRRKIWPIILKKLPNAHLYILGHQSKRFIKGDDRVDAFEADSVQPYLYACDAVIVPLRFESGTRFKILEAGAFAKPVISTSLGAEGLNLSNGKNILIADNPKEFADHVIRAIEQKQLATKLGENLRRTIQKDYSLSEMSQRAVEIINYLKM